MYSLDQQVLRTDIAGMPLDWVSYRDAVRLYHLQQVEYTCGALLYRVRGGINARTRCQSIIDVNSIIATRGDSYASIKANRNYTPPLSNESLFARDGYLCLYCGGKFGYRELSRDHVTPMSQGGMDDWKNVVTACKRCNNHKAGCTPERAKMKLLAVPFVPTHAEYVFLRGRRVLADQMQFLIAHFPRTSPLHQRIRMKYQ
jgi:5-methylcytosine-specific restriction endonuclease McrA